MSINYNKSRLIDYSPIEAHCETQKKKRRLGRLALSDARFAALMGAARFHDVSHTIPSGARITSLIGSLDTKDQFTHSMYNRS